MINPEIFIELFEPQTEYDIEHGLCDWAEYYWAYFLTDCLNKGLRPDVVEGVAQRGTGEINKVTYIVKGGMEGEEQAYMYGAKTNLVIFEDEGGLQMMICVQFDYDLWLGRMAERHPKPSKEWIRQVRDVHELLKNMFGDDYEDLDVIELAIRAIE